MDDNELQAPETTLYGENTLRNFEGIQDGSVHYDIPNAPEKGRPLGFFHVRNSSKETATQQYAKNGLSKKLFEDVKRQFPSKKALAKTMGITSSAVAMGIHYRGFNRNQIITLMLLKTKKPNWRETNRQLMRFGEPALSNSEREGKRNYLIGKAFDSASYSEIGEADYLGLLQIALREMGLKPTVGRKRSIPSKPALREKERELINNWKAFAAAVLPPRALNFRLELLDRFCEQNDFITESERSAPDRAAAYDKIVSWMSNADKWRHKHPEMLRLPAPPSKSALMKYFQEKSFRYGTREDIVWVFSALGISLKEMNRVLAEADCAALYPNSVSNTERLLIKLFTTGGR